MQEDTVLITGSIFDHAGERKTTQARARDHVCGMCVYLLVCACTVTKREFMRGHRWIQGGEGKKKERDREGGAWWFFCCAFSGPASPCLLLPSVESISDCIMLGRQENE